MMGDDPTPAPAPSVRPGDRTDTFSLFQEPNEEYRLPLTVLTVLAPLGLLAELYRFMAEGLRGTEPLFEVQWRQLGALIGIEMPVIPVLILIVGCLGVHLARRYPFELPGGWLLTRVVLWGALWALVRYVVGFTTYTVMHLEADVSAFAEHTGSLGVLGLAMSAALQEELVFRGAVLGILVLAARGLTAPRWSHYLVALPLSAALFSIAHTTVFSLGAAEPFTPSAFVHRFIAGMLYGLIFLRQGLAVTTLAHFGYNAMILLRIGPWMG